MKPSRIAAALNIHPDEGMPVLCLLVHSFFSGIVVAFYFSAATALFLEEFDSDLLPPVYIGSAVVVFLVSLLYRRAAERYSLGTLSIQTLSFLCVSVGIFSFGINFTGNSAVVFATFAWFQVVINLTGVQFWAMSNRFFDLRQAKRLFGLIGTGAALSGILGYFSLPFILTVLPVRHLFTLCALIMILWILFLLITIRKFPSVFSTRQSDIGQAESGGADAEDAAPTALKSRYTTLVFVLAVLPMFGWYLVDYLFLGLTKERFPADVFAFGSAYHVERTVFISLFFGSMRVVELITKALSGRLLAYGGLRVGLSFLPGSLLLSCGLAALAGLWLGVAGWIFFALVALSKLFERVFRPAINDPSAQILYQPIPGHQRLSFQSRVDGVAKPLGVLLVGFALMAFARIESIGEMQILVIVILILLGWLVVSRNMYKEYGQSLAQILERTRKRSRQSLLTVESVDALKAQLRDLHHEKLPDSLRLLQNVEPATMESFLIDLLDHAEPRIRTDALQEIERLKVIPALESVRELLVAEPDPAVRAAADRTSQSLTRIVKSARDYPHIASLAASSSAEERRDAAILLGYKRYSDPSDLLLTLLADRDTSVCRAAIIAAGRVRDPRLWPALVEQLSQSQCATTAVSAAVDIGEDVLPDLERFFGRSTTSQRALVRVVQIVGRIGGESAARMLWRQFPHPDTRVEHQILVNLNRCGGKSEDSKEDLVKQKIDETIDDIAWSMAAVRDIRADGKFVQMVVPLGSEIDRHRERLLLLLSLRFDPKAIGLINDLFRESSRVERKQRTTQVHIDESKVYALEMADVFIPEVELKKMILPALEDDSAIGPRLKRLETKFPQQHLSGYERLKDVVNRDYTKVDSWIKAAALDLLSSNGSRSVPDELMANFYNPHFLLQETAARGIYRIAPEVYEREVRFLERSNRLALDAMIVNPRSQMGLAIEKVEFLKGVEIFSDLPEATLIGLVPAIEEVELEADTTFIREGDTSDEVYFIVEGRVRVERGEEVTAHLGPREFVGEMASLKSLPRSGSITTVVRTRMLRVPGETFLELVSDHLELIGGRIVLLLYERFSKP